MIKIVKFLVISKYAQLGLLNYSKKKVQYKKAILKKSSVVTFLNWKHRITSNHIVGKDFL